MWGSSSAECLLKAPVTHGRVSGQGSERYDPAPASTPQGSRRSPALPLTLTLTSDPLSLIISKQQREQLRVALADLSATDQEILHLSFFEGLSPAEIADHLNEPAERIRKRKSRALLRLRSAFLGKTETGHESGSPPTY